jgi:hypothetical protein
MDSNLLERMLDIAARDKSVNYEQFEKFARANMTLIKKDETGIPIYTSKSENPHLSIKRQTKELQSLKFNDDNGIRDIQGATARPGFGPTLKKYPDLREDTNEAESVYEVYYNDTIPIQEYRQMARDPQLKLGLLLIVGLVSGLKYSISSEDKVIKEVLKKLYGRHHNSLVRKMIRISFREGFTFAEKVFQRETVTVEGYSGKAVGMREIAFQDPLNNFSFYKSGDSNQIHSIKQRQGRKEVELKRSRILWFSLDEEFGEVFGESRFKPAYPFWYYDKIGYQWRVNSLEKSGAPHLEGRYPQGSTNIDGTPVNNGQVLLDLLVQLTSTGHVVMPSSRDENGNLLWDIQYREPKNTKSEAFTEFSMYNDRKKLDAIGIMGSIFEQGSFSDTDAKADLLMAIMEDAINQIEETIGTDIIDYLVSYNFGPDAVNTVKFEIDRTGLGRRSMLKEILINAMRTQSSTPNYRPKKMIDIQGLLDEFGIETSVFEDIMEVDPEKESKNEDPSGPTPLEEKVRNDAGNDPNQNRPNETVRDRGRKADRKPIT